MIRWMAAAAPLALAACGGGDAGGNTTAATASATAGPAGWNAVDACTTVGTATVAQATGKAVTGTALDPVGQPDTGKASFSMCTFALAGGAKLTVLTREAPDADSYDASIADARKLGEEFGYTPVDVPGLGKAAMWTAKPPSLQVFIDDRRYATISMFGADFMPDASKGARAAATAVARKLVS